MSNGWFETVAEGIGGGEEAAAPVGVRALVAGSENGVTSGQRRRLQRAGFAPHVAGLSAQRDLSTTVMVSAGVAAGAHLTNRVQAVHPDGEVAVARAAAAGGRRWG